MNEREILLFVFIAIIKTISVAGAGTMGRGIAQVIAQAGYRVILFDINRDVLGMARLEITKRLEQLVVKQKISAEQSKQIQDHIRFTNTISDCKSDLVIEAALEDLAVKKHLFLQLAGINTQDCILSTNTSSLPVTDIAATIPLPARFAGLHFFNPAPLMKLVEVVQTKFTSPDVTTTLCDFVLSISKVPVVCQDAPGFIVNHVARPYYLEALRLLGQGIEPSVIDDIMEATGFKMGPFRLMDLIGNDINYAVSVSVYNALGKPSRLEPSPAQKELVENKRLGQKSGSGFYSY
ncbi:MAG TPA: 3-hydroxyacyl-CoA dehydrogenase NAD-binding domain-containing protein [Flavitalea sp.]|nr:3-hydroxyacyl-CoA dehydrogenase NAD-binding domain-containing protein [Flavitalea sp.]